MENTIQEELRREAFNNLMSSKYYVHGNCFKCGIEYNRCTNRESNKDFYCSDDCYDKSKKDKIKRDKEKHHYEVYKDHKFYYLIIDSVFHTKRNFNGKTWMKKSEQEIERKDDVLKRIDNWKHPTIPEKMEIPLEAIKIIDKVSAYLYDNKHIFNDWKKLKEVRINS